MAINFYKQGGSYYTIDGKKVLNLQELQKLAREGGKEVSAPSVNNSSQTAQTPPAGMVAIPGAQYNTREKQRAAFDNIQAIGNTLYGIPKQSTAPIDNGQSPIEETPQQAVDNQYVAAAAQNPAISTLMRGGSSVEEIINALSTGDLSGIVDWQGKPFSVEDQQAALAKGTEDNRLFYEAQQQKEKADVEANLAQKQADYQDYLINSGQAFEADKTALDQQSANAGILFSGARAQKEKNLERAYMQDQASKLGTVARNIGRDATDFQYKYGNDAASGLNQYYGLGGNTFNSKVARGGVGASAISNVYNPANYNFQGTRNTERKANANTRAAGYLWNKGNKLLASGYNNQY